MNKLVKIAEDGELIKVQRVFNMELSEDGLNQLRQIFKEIYQIGWNDGYEYLEDQEDIQLGVFRANNEDFA